jgi:hypothetical protein
MGSCSSFISGKKIIIKFWVLSIYASLLSLKEAIQALIAYSTSLTDGIR